MKPIISMFNTYLRIMCCKIRYGSKFSISLRQRVWEKDTKIVIRNKSHISIGRKNNFRSHLTLRSIEGGEIIFGENCFCNTNVSITSMSKVSIGNNVKIANNVVIIDHDHDYRNNNVGYTSAAVTIGDNVWIGANAVILKGVTIGQNVVVAAGSVVNKDIPAFCVVAGVPARVIKENKNGEF